MGLLDAFIPKDQLARADVALAQAEVQRKERIRVALAQAGIHNPTLTNSVFTASSQGPSLTAAAAAAGQGYLAEILNKIAGKLGTS